MDPLNTTEQIKIYRFKVSIDGVEETFEAFTNGRTWNGFACPEFCFEEAMKVAAATNVDSDGSVMIYVPGEDKFKYFPNGFESSSDEVEEWGAREIEVDGQTVKTYAIGAHSWAWAWTVEPCESNPVIEAFETEGVDDPEAWGLQRVTTRTLQQASFDTVIPIYFRSVWDEGVVETPAKLSLSTGQVFDIEVAPEGDDLGSLQCEQIVAGEVFGVERDSEDQYVIEDREDLDTVRMVFKGRNLAGSGVVEQLAGLVIEQAERNGFDVEADAIRDAVDQFAKLHNIKASEQQRVEACRLAERRWLEGQAGKLPTNFDLAKDRLICALTEDKVAQWVSNGAIDLTEIACSGFQGFGKMPLGDLLQCAYDSDLAKRYGGVADLLAELEQGTTSHVSPSPGM